MKARFEVKRHPDLGGEVQFAFKFAFIGAFDDSL